MKKLISHAYRIGKKSLDSLHTEKAQEIMEAHRDITADNLLWIRCGNERSGHTKPVAETICVVCCQKYDKNKAKGETREGFVCCPDCDGK